MIRDWICHFCLSPTRVEDFFKPERCLKCDTVYCLKCKSVLKVPFKFCYGCGEVDPKIEARFTASDSTASIYLGDNWARKNKGNDEEGIYYLWTGVNGYEIYLHKKDGIKDFVRKLNDEEINFLKGNLCNLPSENAG